MKNKETDFLITKQANFNYIIKLLTHLNTYLQIGHKDELVPWYSGFSALRDITVMTFLWQKRQFPNASEKKIISSKIHRKNGYQKIRLETYSENPLI